MVGLLEVLSQFGFDPNCKARMARHQDTRPGVDFKGLIAAGEFEEYQSWQARQVFHNADFVVSFLGAGAKKAQFYGVYRVLGHREVAFEMLPERSHFWQWKEDCSHFHYDLERIPDYEYLTNKLVIKWSSEVSWVQHLKNSEVIECPPLRDIDLPTWSPLFVEGKTFAHLATSRERSRQARDKCLEFLGCKCSVCDMTFPATYGGLGMGFMHVHHNTLVSSQPGEYELDPKTDLKPVCPNCHAMLHWNVDTPRTIEELRMLRSV